MGVNLNWVANSESDVVGYNVYRSGSANRTFEKLNATGMLGTTSYSDASAPKGEVSFYRVTALDGGKRVVTETSISTSSSQCMSTPSLLDSQYALMYKPPTPGTYEVVVTFDGDADHLGSTSVVRSFQVT